MIKALLFDLDGTLVDSLADLVNSINSVLAREDLPLRQSDEVRQMIGQGMVNLVHRAIPETLHGTEAETRLLRAVQAEYDLRCLEETRPYPRIAPLLTELRARGIALAVLSNKPDAFVIRIVDALFPEGTFGEVRGECRDFPKKPDPASALDIARRLGIESASCAFVGDSGVDIATGKAAGMLSIGVTWGYRERAELEAAEAAVIVDRAEEILGLLGVN
ncbi:MAG: HAD-IA family hydrolase [Spirochaetota bacterium]